MYFAAVLALVVPVRNFLNTPPPLAHATISSASSSLNVALWVYIRSGVTVSFVVAEPVISCVGQALALQAWRAVTLSVVWLLLHDPRRPIAKEDLTVFVCMEELVVLTGHEVAATDVLGPGSVGRTQELGTGHYGFSDWISPPVVVRTSLLTVAFTTAPSTGLWLIRFLTVTTRSTQPDWHLSASFLLATKSTGYSL